MHFIHKTVNLYGSFAIGNNTKIGAFCDISGQIGSDCKIQAGCIIAPKTRIGRDVFLGQGVMIGNDPKMDGNLVGAIIKDGAKIGSGAIILGGVVIGKNSIIGAGSVVLEDIPDNSKAVGNPAKLI